MKKAAVALMAATIVLLSVTIAFAHNYTWDHHVDDGVHKYRVTLFCPTAITEDSAANPSLTNYDPGVAIVYKCSTP
jgi:hypothetical protein